MIQVDFLYWSDCPSHEEALARLREALAEAGVAVEPMLTEVTDEEMAENLLFLGSPTIRVNGDDIEPGAEERQDYGLSCRAYTRADGRISPLPPREMIQAALRRAARG